MGKLLLAKYSHVYVYFHWSFSLHGIYLQLKSSRFPIIFTMLPVFLTNFLLTKYRPLIKLQTTEVNRDDQNVILINAPLSDSTTYYINGIYWINLTSAYIKQNFFSDIFISNIHSILWTMSFKYIHGDSHKISEYHEKLFS